MRSRANPALLSVRLGHSYLSIVLASGVLLKQALKTKGKGIDARSDSGSHGRLAENGFLFVMKLLLRDPQGSGKARE
jgi:hypothetical protein